MNLLDNLHYLEKKNIVIKIDTEGFEDKVLNGAVNLLTKNNVFCKIEIKDKNIDKVFLSDTVYIAENKKFENTNYESFQFTKEGFDKNFIPRFEKADHILLSIAPINGTDIVIKNLTIDDGNYSPVAYNISIATQNNTDNKSYINQSEQPFSLPQ